MTHKLHTRYHDIQNGLHTKKENIRGHMTSTKTKVTVYQESKGRGKKKKKKVQEIPGVVAQNIWATISPQRVP